jgi:predicted RNase H-like HicB family nuclease
VSLVSKLFGRGASVSKTEHSVAVPILCKFWSEDGVWNGVAEHLPVAVFGETFEAAKDNLRSAIGAHLETVRELDDLDSTTETLLRDAKDFLSVQDIPSGLIYARIDARVTGDHVCAFA